MMEHEAVVSAAITRIAETAEAYGEQAGVGAMEIAGLIVSYLAAHPEWTGAFFKHGSTFDLPQDWLERGELTWTAKNGKIMHPAKARRARVIKRLERSMEGSGS